MTELSERIENLSEKQRALLARLQRRSAAPPEPSGPAPGAAAGPAPLSSAQRRLWFVDQMGGGVAYSAPVTYRIRGPLDPDVLDGALRLLVERHASLRTVFVDGPDGPVQVTAPVPERVLRTESVRHLPEADREAAALDRWRAEVGTPFDLATGPVVRVLAVELDPLDHLVVLNIHHITSDQWSMGVVVRELPELWAAARDGRAPVLPPLPVSYADYAVWEQEGLAGGALADGLENRARALDGVPVLEVPGDRPRPRHSEHRGAETARWLGPDVVAGLGRTCETTGTSPFMALLGGFAALMSRYCGTDDVALGTTSAGRDAAGLDGLVGFFVNTLVLRIGLDGDPGLGGLLERVRAGVLDAHRHAGVPFDQLVERLAPVREPGRPPLIPVMFQQDNTPDCALSLPGLDVALVDDVDPGTAKYDLLVSVRAWDGAVRVHVQYDSEIYDAETVDALLAGYEALLDAAFDDPSRPVSDLPVMSPRDERCVTELWNRTDAETTLDVCLHTAFERWADRTPDAVAAVAGRARHTFAEVEERANRLGHHLRALGVAPGLTVAVHLPSGVDRLVAELAVLKAGGAFVPVDPQYPAARVRYVLEDAASPVVVTTEALAADLDLPDGPSVVRTDAATDRAAVAARPAHRPDGGATPDDLCYLIYTSGSTGRPKGVELRHRGVANNLDDLRRAFGIGPGDAVLALSSPSFDMSVFEVLGLPLAGGTVVFADPELARDPAHWAELAVDESVTVWNSAPALLDLFLGELEQSVEAPPETLRLALLGGDWVPVTMPGRLRSLVPDVEFVALGGATEASIHSIVNRVGDVDPSWTVLPYGRPMANQHAYVLDDRGAPCPVGVPGELHLGGVGLAAGYANRPDLTSEKFVSWRGRRLYRTGDLARWDRDGVLHLLGRRDHMVKVNGLRIELGEIESTLRAHPEVDDAVVLPHTDDTGVPGLTAFVAVAGAVPADLREHLSTTLPATMVPSRFAALDRLPLSPNGKVDRGALAARCAAGACDDAGPSTEPPRGPVEERVARAWCDVLGLERVGRDDDFFARGGDSFKAVRLARLLGGGTPVIAVFRNPTVATLAEHLGTVPDGDAAPVLLHRLTPPRTARTNLVCVPYGGGNAVAYQPLADALPDDWALWSVDLPGHDLADSSPLEDIDDVAARCAQEVRDRVGDGAVALYGQCAGTAATIVLARRLEALGVPVAATFLGAALPDPDPERSWQMVQQGTDDQLLGHMRGLGGFDGVLSEDDVAGILRVVRHDLAQAVGFYLRESRTGPGPVLSGPVHCIVGDDDPATDGYAERYRDWGRYGDGGELAVVPGGGHYFCKHRPVDVAAVVTGLLPGEEDGR